MSGESEENMSKEIVFSIMIITTIIIANVFVSHFIDGKLNNIVRNLNEINEFLENNNYDEAKNKIEELHTYWRENEALLSCYIEHDELEKVKLEYTELKAYIKSENDQAFAPLYKMIFVIQHIEQKDDLRIKNIL